MLSNIIKSYLLSHLKLCDIYSSPGTVMVITLQKL